MKQRLVTFLNNPAYVSVVALAAAVIIGILGYVSIHRVSEYTFTAAGPHTIEQVDGATSAHNLTLGFLTGGRIASVKVQAGDSVKKGQLLASLDSGNAAGLVSQAKAAYLSAQANYQKVINGATGTAVDVAKAALNTAQVNLTETTKSQTILVDTAYRNFLNSNLVATSLIETNQTAPVVSGTYLKSKEGSIRISVYQTADGGDFTLSGLVNGTGRVSSTIPQALGDSGLFIQFPSNGNYTATEWSIDIPNTRASNYLANYNAYQQALQTKNQTITAAQAAVDQAQANLAQVVSAARPEDIATAQAAVENAKGALQVAEAAYANTVIVAPGDGTVTAVSIAPGQIATSNTAAIELFAATTSRDVSVAIPLNAVLERNGARYVLKKTDSGVVEQNIATGISDDLFIEVLTGLTAGDEVALH